MRFERGAIMLDNAYAVSLFVQGLIPASEAFPKTARQVRRLTRKIGQKLEDLRDTIMHSPPGHVYMRRKFRGLGFDYDAFIGPRKAPEQPRIALQPFPIPKFATQENRLRIQQPTISQELPSHRELCQLFGVRQSTSIAPAGARVVRLRHA